MKNVSTPELNTLRAFLHLNKMGNPDPTLQELADSVGCSVSTAFRHTKALEEAELLVRVREGFRSFRLTRKGKNAAQEGKR